MLTNWLFWLKFISLLIDAKIFVLSCALQRSHFSSLFDYGLVFTFYFLKDKDSYVASGGSILAVNYSWRHLEPHS